MSRNIQIISKVDIEEIVSNKFLSLSIRFDTLKRELTKLQEELIAIKKPLKFRSGKNKK